MRISTNLYSFRHETEAAGIDEVLKNIKRAGFGMVETAGFGDSGKNLSAEEYACRMTKAGLKVSGMHVGLKEILEQAEKVISDAKTLQTSDIIVPYLSREDLDSFNKTAEDLQKAYTLLNAGGLRIGYHNHDHEFIGGDFIGKLAAAVSGILFEPDIFWLKVAGLNPKAYCEGLGDRLMTIHLKELSKNGKDEYNPFLGDGVSEIKECIKLAANNGLEYVVFEAEKFREGVDYTEYLKQAAAYINSVLSLHN